MKGARGSGGGARWALCGASLLLSSLALTGPARAQDQGELNRRLAQSLFDHARLLLETGRAVEACPKFAESYRLEPASGTLLNLALCHEQEGKTTSAWAEYHESLSLALREGRQDREQIARERLAALEPRLLFVSVAPSPGADIAGLEVRFDGAPLRRAAWGTPTVVDPGSHRVEVEAPGRVPWSITVVIEGPGRVHAIDIPPLATPPPPPQAVPVVKAPPDPALVRRRWAYGVAGVAGASLVVSVITGVVALQKESKAEGRCWEAKNFCTTEGIEARDSARAYAWASTISLGVSLAAAAAVPLVLWKSPSEPKKSLRAAGGFGPGSWTLSLGGSF